MQNYIGRKEFLWFYGELRTAFIMRVVSYCQIMVKMQNLTLPVPIPDKKRENEPKFLFSHYFVVPQKVL